MNCRGCGQPLEEQLIDLGTAPPSNAYLQPHELNRPERHFPLRVMVCTKCWLVQTEDFAQANELFTEDYAYFSSTSSGWLRHAATYVADISKRLGLGRNSFVVEVASNDGYLLQNFVRDGVPCLGVEPTASTAAAARKAGVEVEEQFFGTSYATDLVERRGQADLIIGNNVYAHVPDINDFTGGIATALKPDGVVTLEFPHLLSLISEGQFDTIYHEHYSYLSLLAAQALFARAGLRIFDVEKLPTHGGSLRLFGCHESAAHPQMPAVEATLQQERDFGLNSREGFQGFQQRAEETKNGLLEFLIAQKRAGKRVVAYGAAAKGNTLLNFAGVRPDLLPEVFDAAVAKQGQYLPGSRIPIRSPEQMAETPFDAVLILPWNIAAEVKAQLASRFESIPVYRAVPSVEQV